MKNNRIFSSESVGEGHPDKVADLISDTIVDACLAQDPASRVACETLVKDGHVILAGEITTKAVLDYETLVRDVVRSIGYDSKNPLIMLPDKIGDGATISTYFGDAYIPAADDDEKVLHYGGGWNSRACAGLFNFAASSAIDEVHTNTSGRMMYIK